jgi:hypothetical protein
MLAFGVFALSAWQISTPASAAQCGSSTPTSVTQPDGTRDTVLSDGTPPPYTGAPDFTAVHVAVDSDCAMTLSYRLNRPSGEHWLMARETAAVFIDTDGNAGTGDAGFERALITIGSSYLADRSQLESWNGTEWVAQEIPVTPGPGGAQRLTFDALGISAPTTVNVRAISKYTDFSGPDRDEFDFAPDDHTFAVQVAFNGPPPPPTTPTPPPGPPARRECTVPNVRGLKLATAKRRLSTAGCRVKVTRARSRTVGRGRIIKTSPRAGRTTSGEVRVTVSRGSR